MSGKMKNIKVYNLTDEQENVSHYFIDGDGDIFDSEQECLYGYGICVAKVIVPSFFVGTPEQARQKAKRRYEVAKLLTKPLYKAMGHLFQAVAVARTQDLNLIAEGIRICTFYPRAEDTQQYLGVNQLVDVELHRAKKSLVEG